MTRRCVIDGRAIRTLADVYAALARQLAFPAHFGRNLDALHDALTGDIAGPIEIVWRDHRLSEAALGADYARLLAVLTDASAARDDLSLILD
ncbi:MAG: barstar family protein [Candidatus Eiseniibacteriota bacterium]